MKLRKALRFIGLFALIGWFAVMAQSCSDDKETYGDSVVGKGSVTGIVTDELASPIAGVTVTDKSSSQTTTTGTDGRYTLSGIDIHTEGQIVLFEKDGYETVSVTLVPSSFRNSQTAEGVDIEMVYANASISGHITDAQNGDRPFEGVTVSVTASKTATTDAQGYYEITGLVLRDYTVTISKAGCATVTRNVAMTDFVDGKATVDASIGGVEILRGLTAADLALAPRWYNNEYKGGRNADAYPMFDWSVDYMATWTTWTGDYEEQNEGSTLRIRNDEEGQKNPADTENFDTFVYGRKLITADNSVMTVQVRCHQPPCSWGVQIVDLTEVEPKAELVGSIRVCDATSYVSETFDLSKYVGKEVVVVIGQFRMETGDYWHQLVLRRVAFASQPFTEYTQWLPGDDLPSLNGWHMTESIVRSSMPQDLTHFVGQGPEGNRDDYRSAYSQWSQLGHVMAYWTFMPLHKDPEPFNGDGYTIKTRGNEQPNTEEPESYLYGKFSVKDGQNKLKITTRNYGGNYTFFKVNAITMDCVVTALDPVSNTANEASAAENGCWKFKHDDNKMAEFVYDLSPYNGQDVMITISVHNGELNGDENKLVLSAIDLQ